MPTFVFKVHSSRLNYRDVGGCSCGNNVGDGCEFISKLQYSFASHAQKKHVFLKNG